MNTLSLSRACLFLLVLGVTTQSVAEQRRAAFDRDPEWDGYHNRSKAQPGRKVVQDFGYLKAEQAVGGEISPDGTAAYYAKKITPKNFDDTMFASGTVVVEKGGGNTLLGFFNHGAINEWRTPNSIVFRINGRGEFAHVHIEYATSRWRAGASVIGRVDKVADRVYPLEIPSVGVHAWSMEYDPNGNGGGGCIRATFDEQSAVCNLDPGHKADGATFDRFGILNVVKSADSAGRLRVANVSINGQRESFDTDPDWEGFRNRLRYESECVRPQFDFGYSATGFAAGGASGEIGGLFFRGDCRYEERMAYYGDRLERLNLDKPLHASGKVCLRRAVSDSSTLFGFFHARHSVGVNPAQNIGLPMNFMGVSVEGPSSEGFYVYPSYRVHGEGHSDGYGDSPPRILPDGVAHAWTLDYDPSAADGAGEIVLTLDAHSCRMPLKAGHRTTGAEFDRFGLVTPWIDGNGQVVYFDDLEYTVRQ